MIDRVIEIANPVRLSVRDCQLVILTSEGQETTTPIDELAILLIAHPQVILTHAVLSRIAMNGGAVVTCDQKFLPASMLLPLQSHFVQAERFAHQISLTLPRRKRLWQKIVRTKIRAQGNLLRDLWQNDAGVHAMAQRVTSGDTGNVESRAARAYWPLVFGDPKFRRGGDTENQNRHLDYGYTVLRAATARALCAAGLHPSIGLRHHNRYDAFSLAADLMEPFRVLVARRVHGWILTNDANAPLERSARAWMLGIMSERYWVADEQRTLGDILLRAANSLAHAMSGEEDVFDLSDDIKPLVSGETFAIKAQAT
jgi:CRISPR-associated protein Cas1